MAARFTGTMGAAESKSGEGLEDVQEQLKAIRAQEAILLKKMQASLHGHVHRVQTCTWHANSLDC